MKPSRFSFNKNVISFEMMTHSHKFLVFRFDDKQQKLRNTHNTNFEIYNSIHKCCFLLNHASVYIILFKRKSCNKHKSLVITDCLLAVQLKKNLLKTHFSSLRVYRQEAYL